MGDQLAEKDGQLAMAQDHTERSAASHQDLQSALAESQQRVAALQNAAQNSAIQLAQVAEMEERARQMGAQHQQLLQVVAEHERGALQQPIPEAAAVESVDTNELSS